MGISALGTGSSILTQDLLDQLKKADETAQIQPLDLELANQKDKLAEYDVIDANITNLYDAIGELKTPALFDERTTTVSGTSVEVTAAANSDLQDFTLNVTQLATKEINESGSYGATTDTIADGDGDMTLSVGDQDFTIEYTADMTLEDLKKSINDVAGDAVNATIVQVGEGDYRLFLNAANTGNNQDISITDNSGNLSGTQLTDDMTTVQDGLDAEFTFNGQAITRHSNEVDDLITGYDITLKELGSSEVSVAQNRDSIEAKIDSFIEKYNAAMGELSRATKNSTDASERGIFAGESTMRSLQASLRGMMDNVGGGVGTLYDYGFDIDKDGKLSIDKTVFNKKMDENPANVEAFFSGGEFENADGSTTTVEGAFTEMSSLVEDYTKFNGMLDNFETYLNDTVSSLEDRKLKTQERLDARYETMKQQFAAYDAMIAQFNNSSSAFQQMMDSTKSDDK
jgi:flagellar hook-associated protein 2